MIRFMTILLFVVLYTVLFAFATSAHGQIAPPDTVKYSVKYAYIGGYPGFKTFISFSTSFTDDQLRSINSILYSEEGVINIDQLVDQPRGMVAKSKVYANGVSYFSNLLIDDYIVNKIRQATYPNAKFVLESRDHLNNPVSRPRYVPTTSADVKKLCKEKPQECTATRARRVQ